MREMGELLSNLGAQSPREVVIWKARAVGVSADLEAARKVAEAIARDPWRATCGPRSMLISRSEYEALERAGARTQGPRVVASWIYEVLNPQIEHCEDEYEVLAETLTFHSSGREFERLKPLRRALLPDGRAIFDEMREARADYGEIVNEHDGALATLLRDALALFDSLVADESFQVLVAEKALRKKRARTEAMALAACIVNGAGPRRAADSLLAEVWNTSHDMLLEAARPELHGAVRAGQHAFRERVAITKQRLVSLRQELSAANDVPIAPARGISLESAAD